MKQKIVLTAIAVIVLIVGIGSTLEQRYWRKHCGGNFIEISNPLLGFDQFLCRLPTPRANDTWDRNARFPSRHQ